MTKSAIEKPLTKQELITIIDRNLGLGLKHSERVIVKVVDYSDNPIAPEKYAYKVFYTQYGKRQKFIYFPNTVGRQYLK